MENTKGFFLRHQNRAHWEKISSNWFDLHDEYSSTESESLFWVNEKSNVAMLGVAAWRAKIPTVCGYRISKLRGSDVESDETDTRKSLGRVDLYLGVEPYGEYVEAKWINRSLFQRDDLEQQKRLLNMTRKNAASVERSVTGKRTGLFFCSYYCKENENRILDDKTRDLVASVKKLGSDISFAFWRFLNEDQRFPDGHGYQPIGMIVLGRSISRD